MLQYLHFRILNFPLNEVPMKSAFFAFPLVDSGSPVTRKGGISRHGYRVGHHLLPADLWRTSGADYDTALPWAGAEGAKPCKDGTVIPYILMIFDDD